MLAALLLVASGDAFAVLAKHCTRCHGPKERRAGFDVLDRPALLARGLVVPGKPDDSELWWHASAGAMPPGTAPKLSGDEKARLRRWIEDGAPPLSEAGVLARVAADWQALPAERRKEARYVSFHVGGNRASLEKRLAEFKAGAKLHPVEPALGLHRVHLAELGWDRQRFKTGPKDKPTPSPLDGFDLLLLEYPYAVLPLDASALSEMLRGRVRPVPFVRGDWLLSALCDERLAAELALVAGTKPPPAMKHVLPKVDKARAALELGWRGDAGTLKRALDESGLPELFLGGDVPRGRWEACYAQVARRLDLGTALVPVDALRLPDLPGEGTTTLAVETLEAKTAMAATRFWEKDFMEVRVSSSRTGVLRLMHLDQDGGVMVPLRSRPVVGGEPFRARDAGDGYEVEKEKGPNRWTVFVAPGAGAELPPAATHRLAGARSRLVHRVHALDGKSVAADAHRIVKRSAEYEALGPRKKEGKAPS
ncbi:MAG: hypothetical protein K2W96_14615 [Gemmataceae bacterium]|nr:hypothetical protein [Gemmataceae bacterium]